MNVTKVTRFQCILKFAERDDFLVDTSEGTFKYDGRHSLPPEVIDFIKSSEYKVTTTSTGFITEYTPQYICDGCYKTGKSKVIRIQVGRDSGKEKTICHLCKECFKNLLRDMENFNKNWRKN